MFDKLIESDSHGAEFKNRGRYFALSAFVMGILFLTGVMVSIYAADFDIGTSGVDVAQLIAPVAPMEPQPEPPKSLSRSDQAVNNSVQIPTRQAAIQNITEIPNKILPVSSVPSQFKERPEYGSFKIGDIDIDPPAGGPSGISGSSSTANSGLNAGGLVGDKELSTTPPPIAKTEPKKNNAVVSLGVVNGKATSLPMPPYPAAAKQLGIAGTVTVQISIDLDGSVTSSKAVNGHPLLKRGAEEAARRARFSPTYLSNQPVRATGMITYNFKKGS